MGLRISTIFLLLAAGLCAQTAQIQGVVVDTSGSAVPEAAVKVTQTNTGAVRTVMSAADGNYVIAELPIGPYRLEVSKDGFTTYVQTGIVLQVATNPTIDIQNYLPRSVNKSNFGYYEDAKEVDIYDKLLHETNPRDQKSLMLRFAKHVMDDESHIAFLLWWYRIVPYRSYMNGWKIGPSHYLNQDLATIWLDAPHCGRCATEPQD